MRSSAKPGIGVSDLYRNPNNSVSALDGSAQYDKASLITVLIGVLKLVL
jgi:hypothetical protein